MSPEKLAEDYDDHQLEENLEEDNLEEDNLGNNEENESDFEIMFKQGQNKHKQEGKHSLSRDVIFQGKLEERDENEEFLTTDFEYSAEFTKIDITSMSDQDDFFIEVELEQDVYEILAEETNIDFTQNRRKPKREDFNQYYEILTSRLKSKFTYCEIFVALAYYFTDNIFNMFKLLDKKFASIIILELKDKGYLKDIGNINFV